MSYLYLLDQIITFTNLSLATTAANHHRPSCFINLNPNHTKFLPSFSLPFSPPFSAVLPQFPTTSSPLFPFQEICFGYENVDAIHREDVNEALQHIYRVKVATIKRMSRKRMTLMGNDSVITTKETNMQLPCLGLTERCKVEENINFA